MARIAAGEYGPGELLPSEEVLSAEFGIRVKVFRRAIAQLPTEGLIDYGPPGYRNRVRPQPEPEWLQLGAGAKVRTRMPTLDEADEAHEFGLPVGVPALVVDGEVYPGDRYALRVA